MLVLSKPLGTGLALAGGTTADKAAAIAGMRRLNRAASEALQSLGDAVHAVTDVTGYGLAGHGWEMAERSGVRVVVDTSGIVAYPGAAAAAARGVRTGGDPRNRDYVAGHLDSTAARRRRRRCASTRRRRAGCSPPSIPTSPRDLVGGGFSRSAGGGSATIESGAALLVAAVASPLDDGPRTRAPTRSIERELWDAGHDVVVGIDEVGRGAWAGPLMVGAAILPRGHAGQRRPRLEDAHRSRAREAVRPDRRLVRGVGGRAAPARRSATSSGMAEAQRLAARRAIAGLGVVPDAAVVDGNWNFVSPHVAHVELRVKADPAA